MADEEEECKNPKEMPYSMDPIAGLIGWTLVMTRAVPASVLWCGQTLMPLDQLHLLSSVITGQLGIVSTCLVSPVFN